MPPSHYSAGGQARGPRLTNSEHGTSSLPPGATVVEVGASVVTVVGGSLNRLVVSVVSWGSGEGMVAGGAVVAGASVVSTALVAGVVSMRAGAAVTGAVGDEGAPAAATLGEGVPPETGGAGEAGVAGSLLACAADESAPGAAEVSVAGRVVETGAGGGRRAATDVVVCTVPVAKTSSLTSGRCVHAAPTSAMAANALPATPIARRRPGAMPAHTARERRLAA